jgi:hypothetical protein
MGADVRHAEDARCIATKDDKLKAFVFRKRE